MSARESKDEVQQRCPVMCGNQVGIFDGWHCVLSHGLYLECLRRRIAQLEKRMGALEAEAKKP